MTIDRTSSRFIPGLPQKKIAAAAGNFLGLTPVYASHPDARDIATSCPLPPLGGRRCMMGTTMRSEYLSFRFGAPQSFLSVLRRLVDTKLAIPVFVIGSISIIVMGSSILPQHWLVRTANATARQPVALTMKSPGAGSSALPNYMTTFVFGFLEFDWPPGQVPGFGPIT
jgi:hypothetical protein